MPACKKRIILGGLRQALKAGLQASLSLDGFRPFLETHFDSRRAKAFSAEGYHRLYLAIARLLRDKPAYRGVISTSWWHDPVPNLVFLNDLPLSAGAQLYRMDSDERTVTSATRISRERTAAYQGGTYHPTNYTLAWSRRDLLRWAEGQSPLQKSGSWTLPRKFYF